MGWSGGSELADLLFDYVKIAVSDEDLLKIMALKFTQAFEDYDCDTIGECKFVEEYLTWSEENERWEFKK